MKTFRAKFTHSDQACGHLAWETHGQTGEEALWRMREAVEFWAVTTGNQRPLGSVEITDVTEEAERQVAEYLEAIKTLGKP